MRTPSLYKHVANQDDLNRGGFPVVRRPDESFEGLVDLVNLGLRAKSGK